MKLSLEASVLAENEAEAHELERRAGELETFKLPDRGNYRIVLAGRSTVAPGDWDYRLHFFAENSHAIAQALSDFHGLG